MNTRRTEAAESSSSVEQELQDFQSQALERIMNERQLSAKNLAAMVEEDEFEADMLAMQIADARLGEEALTQEVCEKIAKVLNLNVDQLYSDSTAETSVAQPGDMDVTTTSNQTPASQTRPEDSVPASTPRSKKTQSGEPSPTTSKQAQPTQQSEAPAKEDIQLARKQRVRELLEQHLGSLEPAKIKSFVNGIDFGKEGSQRNSKKHLFKKMLQRVLDSDPNVKVTIGQAEIIATALGEDISNVAVAFTKREEGRMDSPPQSNDDIETEIVASVEGVRQKTAVVERDQVLGEIELTGRKMSDLFGGKAKVVRSGRGYEVVARSKISQEELITYLSMNITKDELVELLLRQQSK